MRQGKIERINRVFGVLPEESPIVSLWHIWKAARRERAWAFRRTWFNVLGRD